MLTIIDPATGNPLPVTYEIMRDRLVLKHRICDDLPEPICHRLITAIDVLALAFEQLHQDRPHLFNTLTDTAVTMALLALELRLEMMFPPNPNGHSTLGWLVPESLKAGYLPEEEGAIWTELKDNRNQLVHGDLSAPRYGTDAVTIVGAVIDAISGMPPPPSKLS